jgi:6-phosphofructokinase 1
MKTIAILTGGGDAPGLNAVIRSAVKTAIIDYQYAVLGIKNGFDGFLQPGGIIPLTLESVQGILPRGGTILGTANRGNPFARKVEKDGVLIIEDVSAKVVEKIRNLDLEALIVVGGDGTLRIALEIGALGIPVVGVPKTIDNDICGTDFTFGFDTALNIAMDAIDRLHTTAESHHRVMVLELMGRNAGFIALHAGLAGGADVILIPEVPFNLEAINRKIQERVQKGTHFSIVVVAEGAKSAGSDQIFSIAGDEVFSPRLGGISDIVVEYLRQKSQLECRGIVLGHIQRGGSPTAFDRWLATNFGSEAVRMVAEKKFGQMVSLQNGQITHVSLSEAVTSPKRIQWDDSSLRTARSIGISFGEE